MVMPHVEQTAASRVDCWQTDEVVDCHPGSAYDESEQEQPERPDDPAPRTAPPRVLWHTDKHAFSSVASRRERTLSLLPVTEVCRKGNGLRDASDAVSGSATGLRSGRS